MMADLAWWLRLVGPTVGFLGALFLAVAQQAIFGEIGVIDTSGKTRPFVVLRFPKLWGLGLMLLIVSFVAQTIGFFYS